MGTIAEKLTAVANSKAAIASAITGKGGTVPTKFSDYGTAVSSLPNTYTAGDEGKVVSNGALVSQTSLTITENNTYDTTTKNSVTVNVSGGGGGGPLAAVASRQSSPTYTVSASDLAGVTKIGDYAFFECSGLTSITIPEGVTIIEMEAFSYCSGLTSITLPDGLVYVRNNAFQRCSGLTSITIPDSVRDFGMSAFYKCSSLTSITIPDGVTSVKSATFDGCSSLATIDFGTTRSSVPTLANVNAFNGLPANYQILVPSALLTTWKATSPWSDASVVDHIVAHP